MLSMALVVQLRMGPNMGLDRELVTKYGKDNNTTSYCTNSNLDHMIRLWGFSCYFDFNITTDCNTNCNLAAVKAIYFFKIDQESHLYSFDSHNKVK